MTDLEVIKNFKDNLILFRDCNQNLTSCTEERKYTQEALLYSHRSSKIVKKLGISSSMKLPDGRVVDAFLQATDSDRLFLTNAIDILIKAEGYLLDMGQITNEFSFNENLDSEVDEYFMKGDYGVAVNKAFKIFKDYLFEKTGTDDNVSLDIQISGADLTSGGDTIGVANQKYSADAFTYSSGGTVVTLSPTTQVLALPQPTSGTAPVTDDVLWGIGVPGGTPSGSYLGTNTITAISD